MLRILMLPVISASAFGIILVASCVGAVGADAVSAPNAMPEFQPAAQSSGGARTGSMNSSRWTFDFRAGELRLFTAADGRNYWYMTYLVVNRTGQDRMWAPRFDLLSDDGQVRRSGRDVPSEVVSDLLRVIGSALLEDQNQVIGELLQGIENAKEGLVVWPATNLAVKELTIFGSGLSGETKVVVDPITGEDVVLSRTLRRDYATAGEQVLRPTEPLTLREQTWVWR